MIIVHLYRGSQSVRAWSKYQRTTEDWTLCGIRRKAGREVAHATEDPFQVSCAHCLDLMRPTASTRGKSATASQ